MKLKRYTDKPVKRVSFSLDDKTIELIKKRSIQLGISKSFYVRKAVAKEVNSSRK